MTAIHQFVPSYTAHSWAGVHVGNVADVLRDLGYQLAVVFDHRLARIDRPNLAMSRLRLSAGDAIIRFRAIVSGSHSAAFSIFRRGH